MEKVEVYKVDVKTTNGLGDTFTDGKEYFDCEDHIVYIATNSPAEIFVRFGKCVEDVRKMGICYIVKEGE